ncbi:unnamed protein product [Rhodiola kirilowii]
MAASSTRFATPFTLRRREGFGGYKSPSHQEVTFQCFSPRAWKADDVYGGEGVLRLRCPCPDLVTPRVLKSKAAWNSTPDEWQSGWTLNARRVTRQAQSRFVKSMRGFTLNVLPVMQVQSHEILHLKEILNLGLMRMEVLGIEKVGRTLVKMDIDAGGGGWVVGIMMWWEKSDWTGYRELGVEKSGRNTKGDSWWETWQESLHQDEWRTDKWAEAEQGTKWGDKWEESFIAGIGGRQGETWHLLPTNDRFEVVDKGCCGTGDIEVSVLCNRLNPLQTCSDPTNCCNIPQGKKFPALIVFGDSIVDPGNNNGIPTLIKANHRPYGQNFKAEQLSIKELIPAYLDPKLKPEDLPTGVSFASGTSGYDPLTPKLASVISMSQQLNYFKEYTSKLKSLVGENQTNTIFTKGLFLVVAGSDDLANTYATSPLRRAKYNISAYTDFMANEAATFFENLYKLGAKKIGVFNAPPLGCLPSQRTLGGALIGRPCIERYNQAAQLYNSKLQKVIDAFNKRNTDALAHVIDIYDPFLDLIQNPTKYAFNLLICYVHSLVKLPENVTIPAIFTFGDSYVDTGNNNDLHTIVKANFQPYGRDFQGGQPTGRFSNGKVLADILVSELGIKEYLPPYLDPKLQAEDLLTGVCFASAGGGLDPLTPQIVSVNSLVDQLEMFDEYKTRLQKIVGVDRANLIVGNSLYIISAGINDIANTYFLLSFRRLQYDLAGYTDLMASSASHFLKNLYKLGARKIGVFNAPPLGCLPAQRTLGGALVGRPCIELYNQAAQLYNSKLQKVIDAFNKRNTDALAHVIEIYNPFLDFIQSPTKYGFEVVDRGCCGTGLLEASLLCNKLNPLQTCPDPTKYIFWDTFNLIICYVHSLLKLPENVTIPAVFIFGDSIFDTGNNNDLHTIVKANFRPYGRDFQGGQPTGRFSNGKVPSDFLVSELGIKEYLPPYLDPKLQDEDLVTGVCFASAGVGFDPLTPQIVSVKSLVDQLEMFDEYKTRLQKIVGIDRANFIIANSLYIIAAGTNDIVNTYFHLSFRCLQYDLAGYIDLMASSASDFLKKLYDHGARRTAIFGIPSIGCTPSQRTLYGGNERVCADICNRPAQLFNSKAQEIMRHLNRELPDINIGYMDGYETLLKVIKNKDQHGFKYVDVGCCGTGLYEVSFTCNKYTNVFSCKNSSEYLFWDSYHPTERVDCVTVLDEYPLLNISVNQEVSNPVGSLFDIAGDDPVEVLSESAAADFLLKEMTMQIWISRRVMDSLVIKEL